MQVFEVLSSNIIFLALEFKFVKNKSLLSIAVGKPG